MRKLILTALALAFPCCAEADPVKPDDKDHDSWEAAFPSGGFQADIQQLLPPASVGAAGYKMYKFSNSGSQEDIEKILKEHGLPPRHLSGVSARSHRWLTSPIAKVGSGFVAVTGFGYSAYLLLTAKPASIVTPAIIPAQSPESPVSPNIVQKPTGISVERR